ncbi:hypothetical protein Sya03_25720 [Spirilliplanes yamanashiensis]|uniref:1,4-alpha-D-glucan glucanohydrolase n=1 Tax=Spirilliplanes yamanashiensis TaxID=42233 RepID=A0A8J3Y8J8_9ACTN|nr:pullulanase-type alpha-1,6-glucosidase [Spirilliplanes yamanashiensis]MDP9817127.1 pullulanase-type alpha-1,6-glucosidase [Spirilliplanes yamanashiensis]GIJ03220.1 hypothetical protein Sya03_25720 [Spirilliplanes yamanashiensis]
MQADIAVPAPDAPATPPGTGPDFLVVHYHRGDGAYDDWSLYAWGDVAEPVGWPVGQPFAGEDATGRFAWVRLAPGARDVGFLVVDRHGGKDVALDRYVDPSETPEIWLVHGDPALHDAPPPAIVTHTVAAAAAPDDVVTIHHHRPDGDHDGWGLHVWEGVAEPTSWHEPLAPAGFDAFGAVYRVPVEPGAAGLRYVLHRGEAKDLPVDQRLDLRDTREVWLLAGERAPVRPQLRSLGPELDPARSLAVFVDRGTIALPPEHADLAVTHELAWPVSGTLRMAGGELAGERKALPLTARPGGLFQVQRRQFPHLGSYRALAVPENDPARLGELLRGQLLVVGLDAEGRVVTVTGVQLPGILDDLYADARDAPIGPGLEDGRPTLAVWAPTARTVTLQLWKAPGEEPREHPMTRDDATGIWSVTGRHKWLGRAYRFAVEVWHPAAQAVVTESVTDPYAVALTAGSAHAVIADLTDPALAPPGWDRPPPRPVPPARAVIAETSVREFSYLDASVPAEHRGTYRAFTHPDATSVRHLRRLADAGLTHLHLLPAFDFATVPDRRADQAEPEGDLASFPPDSPEPQARVAAVADRDGWNWGYDPLHYNVPEGSFATDPDGPARTREFREMVAALHAAGLRVVMDVVYNHTMADGLAPYSVLDRIVPGYYHRLLADGTVAASTCCSNTASEHAMTARLVVDSVVFWARHYRVDGFRFDLMGHHPRRLMLDVRAALDALPGGRDIYLYGEGWEFGEVAGDARFVQATQRHLAGTGIGSFNDRLRDAARGGVAFEDNPRAQGFATGLWTAPNGDGVNGDLHRQRETLLHLQDRIKVGLTGNLAAYMFTDHRGRHVTGAQVDYNGSPTGYAGAPGECVTYVDAHDNEILYDALAFKLPVETAPLDRARAQLVALALVLLGQGVGFFALGSERLRSKSLDRNSYNSGDWFNAIRWDPAQGNGFGLGLPPFADNEHAWPYAAPLLADASLVPDPATIAFAEARFAELLRVRASSPLFGLPTLDEVQRRLTFPLSGPGETPGVLTMHLDGAGLDPRWRSVTVVINAGPDPAWQTVPALIGAHVALHPVLRESADPVLRTAAVDPATGTCTVPGRSVAVYVES